jgi:hypothetical protein
MDNLERQPIEQIDRFKSAARALECDEGEAHWDERLKRIAKAKPAPEKPE